MIESSAFDLVVIQLSRYSMISFPNYVMRKVKTTNCFIYHQFDCWPLVSVAVFFSIFIHKHCAIILVCYHHRNHIESWSVQRVQHSLGSAMQYTITYNYFDKTNESCCLRKGNMEMKERKTLQFQIEIKRFQLSFIFTDTPDTYLSIYLSEWMNKPHTRAHTAHVQSFDSNSN